MKPLKFSKTLTNGFLGLFKIYLNYLYLRKQYRGNEEGRLILVPEVDKKEVKIKR